VTGESSEASGHGTASTAIPTDADHDDAHALADAAGALLVELREELGFDDPRALGAAGDRRSDELILARLRELHPHDAVLSEESADDRARLDASRVWIVDPLDGTREYGERGRSDFAVHVALTTGGRAVAGAVALPALGVVLGTGRHRPPPPPPSGAPRRVVVSRTRPPAFTDDVARVLGAEVVPMGSAGAKTMAVVRGEADVYLHAGGQYEWDSAAPVAVAEAAGLRALRLDGSELRYNRPDPYLPDLVVCRAELESEVFDALVSCDAVARAGD
jgi:3'(2'), 5'-bisphosphate nucleotidase